MASLPLELIEQICSLLCFHCQKSGFFLDAESKDVRSAKTTLSSFCLVSRRVCAVAQPFLFHYYSAGNLPSAHNCNARADTRDVRRRGDKLPEFLCSIIRRPDLASHVKILQLVETDDISGLTPNLAPFLITASEQVGTAHLAPTQEHLQAEIWSKSRQHEGLRIVKRRGVHHWLEEMAILLSPNVQMIILARDSYCRYEHIRESGITLASLEAIALMGAKKNQHVYEARDLFTAAPNLRTLYSIKCSLFDGLSPWALSKPWMLSLKNLRRLVIADIGFEDLGLLVACCPELRELELAATNIHRTGGINYWDVSKLLQTLQPVRHQLRKLRFTHSPSQRPGMEQVPRVNGASWSFREFTQLEELEFDQTVISCRPRPTNTGGDTGFKVPMIEILPPSIKILHFLCVNKDFMKDFQSLFVETSHFLPLLKSVRVSLPHGIDKRDFGYNYIDEITSSFEIAGVRIQWDSGDVGERPSTSTAGGTMLGSRLIPYFPIKPVIKSMEMLSL
ncbi:f-box domain protein [Colletotrichum truncatum]|uniref:F-box domain protein n=1 Tax=Colletotrichum truncatum TaxID=5467 RepID=A0ACC3Z2P8_COLTU|nr:f-box domain protein [Colletotrichum truncatum]KAF6782665.1 f-box domain protein [Colletotrichum truncatum]